MENNMPVIATVGPQETFLISVGNADYSMMFKEVEVTGTFEQGTVLADATTAVSAGTTDVLGILAKDTTGTQWVRVMVRGPVTVNAQELNIGDADMAAVEAALAEQDIIVINK